MSNQNTNKNILFLDALTYDNKVKVFDIKSHPITNNFAFVDLSGKLKMIKIKDEGKEFDFSTETHDSLQFQLEIENNYKISKSKESLYSLDYSHDGDKILCGSYDGELVIVDLPQTKIYKRIKKAHEDTINKVKFINENIFCSSGANGLVKIFDFRTDLKKAIFEFKEQSEEITDFDYNQESNFLLSTSIDGTLAVYDIRKVAKYKLYALSDCIEDEFYSMKIIRSGRKVACGTSQGPIALFNWDWFGDFKDRIMGHPGSVNCLEKYDENFLISGCEDGGIRFVSVSPKYIHSIINEKNKLNSKKEHFKDVTGLALTRDKKYLAFVSNINCVKIYNIENISIEERVKAENSYNSEIEDKNEENEDINEEEGSATIEDENEESENVSEEDLSRDDILDQDNLEGNDEDKLEPEDDVNNLKMNDDEESFSDSSSSSFKKKKNQKIDKSLKLQQKRESENFIEKERRKYFFSDM